MQTHRMGYRQELARMIFATMSLALVGLLTTVPQHEPEPAVAEREVKPAEIKSAPIVRVAKKRVTLARR